MPFPSPLTSTDNDINPISNYKTWGLAVPPPQNLKQAYVLKRITPVKSQSFRQKRVAQSIAEHIPSCEWPREGSQFQCKSFLRSLKQTISSYITEAVLVLYITLLVSFCEKVSYIFTFNFLDRYLTFYNQTILTLLYYCGATASSAVIINGAHDIFLYLSIIVYTSFLPRSSFYKSLVQATSGKEKDTIKIILGSDYGNISKKEWLQSSLRSTLLEADYDISPVVVVFKACHRTHYSFRKNPLLGPLERHITRSAEISNELSCFKESEKLQIKRQEELVFEKQKLTQAIRTLRQKLSEARAGIPAPIYNKPSIYDLDNLPICIVKDGKAYLIPKNLAGQSGIDGKTKKLELISPDTSIEIEDSEIPQIVENVEMNEVKDSEIEEKDSRKNTPISRPPEKLVVITTSPKKKPSKKPPRGKRVALPQSPLKTNRFSPY